MAIILDGPVSPLDPNLFYVPSRPNEPRILDAQGETATPEGAAALLGPDGAPVNACGSAATLVDASGAPLAAGDAGADLADEPPTEYTLVHLPNDAEALVPYGLPRGPRLAAALLAFAQKHPNCRLVLDAEEVAEINSDPRWGPESDEAPPEKLAWGTCIELTGNLVPDGLPRRGWRMGKCGRCNTGSRDEPVPVMKIPNKLRVCPTCYLAPRAN